MFDNGEYLEVRLRMLREQGLPDDQWFAGKTLLDIGGSSSDWRGFARRGADPWIVDPWEPPDGFPPDRFIKAEFQSMPAKFNGFFDILTMNNVEGYIDRNAWDDFVYHQARMLKPGGTFFWMVEKCTLHTDLDHLREMYTKYFGNVSIEESSSFGFYALTASEPRKELLAAERHRTSRPETGGHAL